MTKKVVIAIVGGLALVVVGYFTATVFESTVSGADKALLHQGAQLFQTEGCVACHGAQGAGPRLAKLQRYSQEDIVDLLNVPPATMPSFQHLTKQQQRALATYVRHTFP